MMPHSRVCIEYPSWVDTVADWSRSYGNDEERMRFAVDIARRNVTESTGGPFGAAIFDRDSGKLVSVGMNSVVRLGNSLLHAETMAFMMAQSRLGSYTLAVPGMPVHDLFTSCEPCAMCLGAALWSGVKRIVYGAARADVEALGFDEGPVFPESYQYLERRGIQVVPRLLREEARAVLDLYRERRGPIYNG